MNWLIIPIEELKQFDLFHEHRRKSEDGTKALIHEELYNELVPPVMTLDLDEESTEPSYPYPLVGGKEIEDMLSTSEWSSGEGEV